MPDKEIEDTEAADPAVPNELLELHVELEEAEVTTEDFKEAYGS